MARISVTHAIASYHTAFLGAAATDPGSFLGWIQLGRADGRDAGYIYLSDTPVEGHLGGRTQPGGPYVVMSRPVAQADLLLTVLQSGRKMQIRYSGEDTGTGIGFLEDLDGVLDAEVVVEVKTLFGRVDVAT